MWDVLAHYDKCCDYSRILLWTMGVEFSPSGTVSVAFQSEDKMDSRMKEGFVKEVLLELTFRYKSNGVTGNPRLVSTESAEISRSEVKSKHRYF